MNSYDYYNDENELSAVSYMPGISVVLPLKAKMTVKREIEYRLWRIAGFLEKELLEMYSVEIVAAVVSKLRGIIKKIDYHSEKKSIAIFVSPVMQKLYYLEIPVEEKLFIDESFEVRDLVYSRKNIHKYLVLVLSSGHSRLFLGSTLKLIRLSSYRAEQFERYRHDAAEKVSNYSDPSHYREVLMEKFLLHVDEELDKVLKTYQLPLFVLAPERVMGHFKKKSHHSNLIAGYVHGNFDDASEAFIRRAIAPYVTVWIMSGEKDMLARLDAARSAGKLATGIRDVWKAITEGRGRLLVVEKNYMCAADRCPGDKLIVPHDETSGNPFYIKDAVDDIIQDVLSLKGDVEFVREGALKNFHHIALIEYY
jgi:hypothetical protein